MGGEFSSFPTPNYLIMNFFEQQDRARQATTTLVGLFIAAVMFTGVCVYFAVLLTIGGKQHGFWDGWTFFVTLFGTAAIMGIVSWSKINQLQSGGAIVAADLGGVRVFPEIATPAEQQLLNIVAEMAISATIAVPPVYILPNELGINSFAAGFTINNAVIGVTKGCLDKLTRDELQGVIAHEFSHILNGDMAINIRLTGMLQGILSLQLMGKILSCAAATSGTSSAVHSLAMLLKVIGSSGYVSGRLIQSAICQQRELLADASAVQFTRNADGVASAMSKINDFGSYLSSPYAETNNHMFFAPAIEFRFRFLEQIFSAHPPFDRRIQIVKGTGKKLGAKIVVNGQKVPTFNPIVSTQTSNRDRTDLDNNLPAVTPVGEYEALAYLYALLLDRDRNTAQLNYLATLEEPAVIAQIDRIRSAIDNISPQQRLARIDLYIPHLRGTAHVPRLLRCADGMVDLLPPENWHTAVVYLILHHQLAPSAGIPSEIYHSIEDVWAEIINILGTIARLTNDKPQDIAYSFEAALMRLPKHQSSQAQMPPELTWREFQTDLSKIAVAPLKVKQTLIAAGLEILTNQRQIPIASADLMRSIAILLDCPIPSRLDKLPTHQRSLDRVQYSDY
jgi:Zn-dependent protease with chaperone function